MISFTDALEIIFHQARRTPVIRKPRDETLGYHAAGEIRSPASLPSFSNSAMDGYAVHREDFDRVEREHTLRLKPAGKIHAGGMPSTELRPGQTCYVATGAFVPEEIRAIVPVEKVRTADNGEIIIQGPLVPDQHIRFTGEDIRTGDVVIDRHDQMNAGRLSLLASLGVAHVHVFQLPEVGFFVTGDELIDPDKTPRPGEIRDSNSRLLTALFRGNGFAGRNLGIMPDDAEYLKKNLRGMERSEIIVSTAGVSVGERDIVRETLEEMGMETIFWRVAIKPGKPLLFGRIQDSLYFGLPGNPVSAAVMCHQIVLPVLRYMAGSEKPFHVPFEATVRENVRASEGRLHFVRAICWYADGWNVRSVGRQGSHILGGFSRANSFILVPPNRDLKKGEKVMIQLMEGPFVGLKEFTESVHRWLS